MLIKKSADIKSSEITDQRVYLNRRLFMRGAVLAGSVTAAHSAVPAELFQAFASDHASVGLPRGVMSIENSGHKALPP